MFAMQKALLVSLPLSVAISSSVASPDSASQIAATIRADVAEQIAGINAHDAARATAFEAADIISMESGRPASVGRDADMAGIKMAFQREPTWHLSLVDEAVDVARSGDMAVYRSTYNQDSTQSGVPATQRVNYIALFKRQADGTWKIAWSVVSNIEKSHKK